MPLRSLAVTSLAAVALLAGCRHHQHPRVCDACVDFEAPLTAGTNYGTPAGNAPGAVVLTSHGISMSVLDFAFVGGGGTFNVATVTPPPAPFGSGQVLRLNNIGVQFDFTALPFAVGEVQVEFLNQGGSENLQVNGSPVPIDAGDLAAAPATIAGVNVSVFTSSAAGGKKGVLLLRGPVKTLRLGGQEFWIDNVCARK